MKLLQLPTLCLQDTGLYTGRPVVSIDFPIEGKKHIDMEIEQIWQGLRYFKTKTVYFTSGSRPTTSFVWIDRIAEKLKHYTVIVESDANYYNRALRVRSTINFWSFVPDIPYYENSYVNHLNFENAALNLKYLGADQQEWKFFLGTDRDIVHFKNTLDELERRTGDKFKNYRIPIFIYPRINATPLNRTINERKLRIASFVLEDESMYDYNLKLGVINDLSTYYKNCDLGDGS